MHGGKLGYKALLMLQYILHKGGAGLGDYLTAAPLFDCFDMHICTDISTEGDVVNKLYAHFTQVSQHCISVRLCKAECGSYDHNYLLAAFQVGKESVGVIGIAASTVNAAAYAGSAGDTFFGVDGDNGMLPVGGKLSHIGIVYRTRPYAGVAADTLVFVYGYKHRISAFTYQCAKAYLPFKKIYILLYLLLVTLVNILSYSYIIFMQKDKKDTGFLVNCTITAQALSTLAPSLHLFHQGAKSRDFFAIIFHKNVAYLHGMW